MDTTRISLRLPGPLMEQIEAARGLIPRERFLRDLIEANLPSEGAKSASRPPQRPQKASQLPPIAQTWRR